MVVVRNIVGPSWRVPAGAVALTLLRVSVYATLAPKNLPGALCQWDCRWYLGIAAHGYDSAPRLIGAYWQANWAFFPLYPLLVRAAAAAAPLEVAGCLVSSLCCVGFTWLGANYLAVTRQHAPNGWVLLVAAWPFGLYFVVPYSEALYAVLATAALLALAERRAWSAVGVTALLTATRPTGILVAAWLGMLQIRLAVGERSFAVVIRLLLPAAVGGLGLLGFMAYLGWQLGNPLAFATIQGAWRHHFSNPVGVLADGFADLDLARRHVGRAYESGWAVIGLVAALWLAWRRRLAEAWLLGATVVMALCSGVVDSMPRFVGANPAFLFAVWDGFALIRWRALRILAILALAAAQCLFVRAWFRGADFLS
jgi:hypothetical protein